jgi:hypothetical protein
MNLLITIFYDWSRVVAGHLTWTGPLAVRIVVGLGVHVEGLAEAALPTPDDR